MWSLHRLDAGLQPSTVAVSGRRATCPSRRAADCGVPGRTPTLVHADALTARTRLRVCQASDARSGSRMSPEYTLNSPFPGKRRRVSRVGGHLCERRSVSAMCGCAIAAEWAASLGGDRDVTRRPRISAKRVATSSAPFEEDAGEAAAGAATENHRGAGGTGVRSLRPDRRGSPCDKTRQTRRGE